ncbi:hypothetical protein SAMN05421810_11289 [Amycolatopsis arida]|uniref:ASCH domain-containing protein n=1 Tax=Amycolatopsis arida TaxID=587909 RepID=A0A1I6AG25_9PSEU|nr:hypothetical protein [Amycolatopsis arida]TDX97710.1 hypothetical protein CLV69_102816 [Amycolatopsis arida]SFQ67620.1 hypothetical protein SAMN05421810_11289 [Amycolatopsis arida]
MLLSRDILEHIAAGRVTVAFRRWRRPTVRSGGTLRTAVGVLRIDAVDPVRPEDITDADARSAGYPDADAVRADLATRPDGQVYRIALALAGPDPREELRERVAEGVELDRLRAALDRLDRASRHGPWTRELLRLVADHPGERAADLAARRGRPVAEVKADVRKLKNLGLTESLPVGYRLSPRGRAFRVSPA